MPLFEFVTGIESKNTLYVGFLHLSADLTDQRVAHNGSLACVTDLASSPYIAYAKWYPDFPEYRPSSLYYQICELGSLSCWRGKETIEETVFCGKKKTFVTREFH